MALGEGASVSTLRGVETAGLHLERGGVDTDPYERGPVSYMITQQMIRLLRAMTKKVGESGYSLHIMSN